MASLNKRAKSINTRTHEGAPATIPNAEEQLKRSIMACMLWEKQFYEDGEDIAERIQKLVPSITQEKLEAIARQAKYDQKIRHAPLLVAVAMARCHKLSSALLSSLIRRPDELSEFLSLYWKDGKTPIAKQIKRGLASAFTKFDEYQLAKWDRADKIKLRDVLFLCHAKPKNKDQEALWKRLIDGTLAVPDTWEVELSATKDKKSSWDRLIKEQKLGAQAFLMNLRNMRQAGVEQDIIESGLAKLNFSKILPFQFISAARYNPSLEEILERFLLMRLGEGAKLPGKTAILVDVSGSMESKLSEKGELMRFDAACGVAIIAREQCENVRVFSFSQQLMEVPPRHGFALRDAIIQSQPHGSTYLGAALSHLYTVGFDRVITVTDEQSHDAVHVQGKTYIVNIASCNRGVGYYGQAVHISGWSEKILDYIREKEGGSNG